MNEIESAIEYLTPISEHPIMTGEYCKHLKTAIAALKEKQEREKGCEYCNPVTSRFEPVYISDTEEDCKWCPKEKCDNHEDSCYGIGYAEVPLKYCVFCGRKLVNGAYLENENSMKVKEKE